jgi:hypothetical protein
VVRQILTIIGMLGVPAFAQAQGLENTYRSSKGYSIQYPTGWQEVDSATRNQLTGAVGGTGGLGPDVIFAKGNLLAGATNINIVVVDDEMPINEEARTILRSMPKKLTKVLGGHAENIVVRNETVNNRAALSLQYDHSIGSKTMTMLQINIPISGRTYSLTYTAPRDEFRDHEPTFRMMIASLETSALASLPSWAWMGIFGAFFGGIVAFFMKFFGTNSASTDEPEVIHLD